MRTTRTRLTGCALLTCLAGACGKDGGSGKPGLDSNQFLVPVATVPQLDLVFMIDNSPSMAPKQEKLRAQFPKLIAALRNPGDGALPDLRVAIIDSDLGTGAAYSAGSCGPNDQNGNSDFGDEGRFRMIGAAACGVTDPSALWLEYQNGAPVNFTGEISDVFACLAGNLGTLGCGFEHQLQAFEFALVAKGVGNEAQQALVRPGAYLGLVFLSDEDDCSAATNDGMFGDKPDLRGESSSLRCATRGHACEDRNLTDAPPGYPTTAAFEAPLSSCVARADTCPNATDGTHETDTSAPIACSPLKNIKHLAAELKSLKAHPGEQVLVSGIFGWPPDEAAMASAVYKIAPVPNPNTADTIQPQIFDAWPVCYDPNHPPSNPDPLTGFDREAAGFGATGGLRMSAFVDEFGANGGRFSICQPDFSAAMAQIGATLAKKMRNQCVPTSFTLATTCLATYDLPDGTSRSIGLCDASAQTVPCYTLVTDQVTCPGDNLLVHLERGGSVDRVPAGTFLTFTCE
jgi:hypothetical protein